ncbi:MAG: ATP-binding cassette domain-containing protein, partial [Paracoccaceae bacterium]
MANMVEIDAVRKAYADGFEALRGVSLSIHEGEILALLGPNGAGKTTLISCICGISQPTAGQIRVGGHDVITEYRAARSLIG